MIRTADGNPAVHGSILEIRTTVVIDSAPASVPDYALQGVISLQHNGAVLAETTDTLLYPTSTGDIRAVTVHGSIAVPAATPVSAAGVTVHAIISVRQYSNAMNPLVGRSIEAIEIYDQDLSPAGLHDTVGVSSFPLDGVLYEEPDSMVIHPPPIMGLSPAVIKPCIDSTSPSRVVVHDTFDPADVWSFGMLGDDGETTHQIIYKPVIDEDAMTWKKSANSTDINVYDPDTSFRYMAEPSLDPWLLEWKRNSATLGSSQSWIVNPSIMSAIHELSISMERHISVPGLSANAYSDAERAQMVKMGRDLFNSLDKVTDFSMLGAEGHMRRMWMICTQHEASSGRYLEEALKAFEFSGQSTTLSVELSTAYESWRSSMESLIESAVKPYKRQLVLRGHTSGGGSNQSLAGGKVPIVRGMKQSSLLRRGRIRAR